MKKWEYKVVNLGCMLKTGSTIELMIQKQCDELGPQGWELGSFQSYDMASKFMLVFKRPIE